MHKDVYHPPTGESAKCSASKTNSGTGTVLAGSSGIGNQLSVSALAWAVVFLNTRNTHSLRERVPNAFDDAVEHWLVVRH